MASKEIAIPKPGTDLVPDGWAESTIVPWLAEQDETESLETAAAQLAGLEAAYKTLGSDTLELVKARRYLEVRWGELLPSEQGRRSDLQLPRQGEEVRLNDEQRAHFRKLAENKLRVVDIIRDATDDEALSRAALLRAMNGAHVGKNAGDNEWYTPAAYIESAVAVMGGIDVDPASSEAANEVVGARVFWTMHDNGLSKPWAGRVWMNPPYESGLVDKFCARLASFYRAGDVKEAIVLVNNATETGWFNALAECASAMCFPKGRVKFWAPGKESAPLQGQAIVYMGLNRDTFREEFSRFGFTVQL